MPLESITCTNCGSGSVQEVKTGTFFCDHCESIFKYVDPTRSSVTQEKAFCWCGNELSYKCFFCGVALCVIHDILRRADDGSLAYEAVATTRGYRMVADRRNVQTRDGITTVESSDDAITNPVDLEAVMPLFKIVQSWENESGGDIKYVHACISCATARGNELAEDQVQGRTCGAPHCTNAANQLCRCCRRPFCSSCAVHEFSVDLQGGSPGVPVAATICNPCLSLCIGRQIALAAERGAASLPPAPVDPRLVRNAFKPGSIGSTVAETTNAHRTQKYLNAQRIYAVAAATLTRKIADELREGLSGRAEPICLRDEPELLGTLVGAPRGTSREACYVLPADDLTQTEPTLSLEGEALARRHHIDFSALVVSTKAQLEREAGDGVISSERMERCCRLEIVQAANLPEARNQLDKTMIAVRTAQQTGDPRKAAKANGKLDEQLRRIDSKYGLTPLVRDLWAALFKTNIAA